MTKPLSSLCSDKSSNDDSNLIKGLSPSVLSLEKIFLSDMAPQSAPHFNGKC